MKSKIMIGAPRAPHAETLQSGDYTILSSDGARLVCWCPRHQCGAVYHIAARVWAMQTPVSFAEFLEALRTNNIVVEQTDDLARWVEACTATAGVRPTHAGGSC